MEWAKSELEHIGRIASVKNPDLQYSYAQHTVSGMLHLRDALKQLIRKEKSAGVRHDLQKLYGQVHRAIQHLVTEYHINSKPIKKFNTRKVLGSINNIKWGRRNTKRNKK